LKKTRNNQLKPSQPTKARPTSTHIAAKTTILRMPVQLQQNMVEEGAKRLFPSSSKITLPAAHITTTRNAHWLLLLAVVKHYHLSM